MVCERNLLTEDMCWQAFQVFDKNGDGKIDLEELKQMLSQEQDVANQVRTSAAGRPVSDEQAEALFKEVDSDGNGEIDFPEFMQMMRHFHDDPVNPASASLGWLWVDWR